MLTFQLKPWKQEGYRVSDVFQILKGSHLPTQSIIPSKTTCHKDVLFKKKKFHNKSRLKEFMTTTPAQQKVLGEIVQSENKDNAMILVKQKKTMEVLSTRKSTKWQWTIHSCTVLSIINLNINYSIYASNDTD